MLGRLIRDAREQRGMSQGKLAELSGVSEATISRIERGQSGGQSANIGRLAKALDIDPSQVSDAMAGHEVVYPERSGYADLVTLEMRDMPEEDQQVLVLMARALKGRGVAAPGRSRGKSRARHSESVASVWGLVPARVPVGAA